MSSVKIEGNASGTGIFTIASPNSNTNRTLTIPDATTTIVGTDATQTLTNKSIVATQLTGTIAAARLPAGSVLQVVSATTTSSTTSTSSTPADVTGFTATITPTSSSSKILVMGATQFQLYRSAAEVSGYFLLLRGSTTIFNQSANSLALEAATNGGRVYMCGWYAPIILDSPATTSATTYKVQLACTTTTSSGSLTVNNQSNNTQTTSMVLMEIAA